MSCSHGDFAKPCEADISVCLFTLLFSSLSIVYLKVVSTTLVLQEFYSTIHHPYISRNMTNTMREKNSNSIIFLNGISANYQKNGQKKFCKSHAELIK